MNELLPYQQRLLEERDWVSSKEQKLSNFIAFNENFNQLEEEEKEDLTSQLGFMRLYLAALNRRIGRLHQPTDADSFDLEEVYDKQIDPLMSQIIDICKAHQMPMIASFCYAKGREKDDPSRIDMCSTLLPRGNWQTPEYKEAANIIQNGASCRPKAVACAITHK